jgi:hypothetical protein
MLYTPNCNKDLIRKSNEIYVEFQVVMLLLIARFRFDIISHNWRAETIPSLCGQKYISKYVMFLLHNRGNGAFWFGNLTLV